MSLHSFYKTRVYPFFDTFEDRSRSWLARRPKLYAFVAGAAIVMLWRAIWHMADIFESYGGWFSFLFSPPVTLATSVLVLLGSGLFVSFFVGDAIIMSGLKKEKKFVDNAQEEMEKEEKELEHIEQVLERIETTVENLQTEKDKKNSPECVEVKTEHRSGGGFQPQ